MSAAFDLFVAGEDGLARLLRALPAFEPPAAMAQRFAQLARQAQVAHGAMPTFEAPAGMEADFLAQADRIQAAQQGRHDAVMDELRAGKPVEAVLGHPVSHATATWLARRQAETLPNPTPRRGRWHAWWPRAGAVLVSALLGVLATQLWLAQRQDAEFMTALNGPAVQKPAPKESIKLAEKAAPVPTPPLAVSDKQAESRPPSPAAERKADAVLARRAAEAAPMPRMEPADRQPEPADAALQEAKKLDDGGIKPKPKMASTEPVATEAEALDSDKDAISSGFPAEMAPAIEEKTPAPAATAMAPASRPGGEMKHELASRLARDDAPMGFTVSLESSPEEAASRWQAGAAGRVPRLHGADPASDAVLAWAERFRQALPAGIRPEKLEVARDGRMESHMLRLE